MDRVYDLMSLMDSFPDNMTDEELEGLNIALPADLKRTITSVMNPRYRDVSIAFFKVTSRWLKRAVEIKESGGKVILVPFNFPPEALFIFEKAAPITSEVLTTFGVAALEGQGEPYWDFAMGLGMPDSLCSANTIELGSALSMEDFLPDAIAQTAPGGCDVNSKIHEFVSAYLDIPQFFLEKPTENTGRGRDLYSKYFHRLMLDLQDFLGEELQEDRVRSVMDNANRCTELYYELWDLRKYSPCPVPNIFNLYTYGLRFTAWGTEDGVNILEMMVKRSKELLEKGMYPAPEERARTLWIYTGYYFDFLGFFNWMEERGITYLGDGLDLYFPAPVDTSSMDTMFEGIAEAAWNMPMTRQVGGESMLTCWLDDILYSINELGATCCIYCGHHACKQTWSVFSSVRAEILKRAGVPTLCLQGDSWIRRMTPTSVLQEEISSFVDNVVDKKRHTRGKRRARQAKTEG
ncbi:MAG: 2-hydroxyacyl-CoA dehydratase [Actinomycetota bacterium]